MYGDLASLHHFVKILVVVGRLAFLEQKGLLKEHSSLTHNVSMEEKSSITSLFPRKTKSKKNPKYLLFFEKLETEPEVC